MSSAARNLSILAIVTALVPAAAWGQTATALDAKVQAPELAAPQRGSVAGQLASVTFGPASVARGAYSLPAPFTVPEDRGKLLASIFPTYSADRGLSEWGSGWHGALAITRYQVVGDLDCATDELTGPFGRLVKGSDAYWYPLGLRERIRVSWDGGETIVAYQPDGTKMTFGGPGRTMSGQAGGVTCTYAWHLATVETVTGTKTRLEYGANASGRLFLAAASYGGHGEDFQYRVELAYEPIAIPFSDYRSGRLATLDRRVKRVTVLVKHAATGVLEERWHYEVGYEAEGLGPAFYLAQVQQVFRSGEKPPATRYAYARAREKLDAVELAENPRLTAILPIVGQSAIQPDRSAALDADNDGLQDLELAYDYRLIRQGEDGFSVEHLAPAAGAHSYCRRASSTLNTPRLLTRLRTGEDEQYVVDLRGDAYRTKTSFTVCNRSGQLVVPIQSLAGDWTPKANIRLVDLNRDQQPDLVRVQYGMYYVLPNTSSPTSFAFGAERKGVLSPAFTPDTVWVHDFNGDGIPDLVARYSSGIVVWFGKGNFEYQSPGQSFPLRSNGTTVTTLTSLAFTFVDANKDGLTDILASRTSSNATYLFVNTGTHLEEIVVPALRSVNAYLSRPVIADLSGSGNTEIAYTTTTKAFAVELDGPEVALMKSADDGKGTVLRFEYARSRPERGARSRQAVLAKVTTESSGYDTISHEYGYEAARLHSTAKFLLGFDRVIRIEPLVSEVAEFLNEDRYSGAFLSSRRHDANAPAVDAFESRSYEDVVFEGVPWKRLKQEASGFVDGAGATVAEQVDYLTYARDFCPETVRKAMRRDDEVGIDPSRVLTTTTTYVHPGAFGAALSCVWVNAVEQGTHEDATLNFRHQTALTRNSVGLVTKVESVNESAARLTLEEASYRPTDWLIETVSSPGKGTTHFDYDPATLLPRSVTTPDGVVVETSSGGPDPARDPLHDGVLALTTTRGLLTYRQFFGYDGLERLTRHWDDMGTATELNPSTQYRYEFATATEPAAIYASVLVDAALASTRDAVDLVTAAGEPIASASRIPQGWAFGTLLARRRATAETTTSLRPTLSAGSDPAALDHELLFTGAQEIGREVSSAHGHAASKRTAYHADVARQVSTDLVLSGELVKVTSIENGEHTTVSWMDAGRRVVAFDDEASIRYEYVYDALGRVRRVRLPDGSAHGVDYDGHARPWRVERTGIPGSSKVTIEKSFQSVTGLVLRKDAYSTPPGSRRTLVRKVSYIYDAIGRVSVESHSFPSGGMKNVRHYYDGATAAQPGLSTALGLLTGTSGDSSPLASVPVHQFTKSFEYRPDGLLRRRSVTFPGWRTVETSLDYLESGIVGSRTTKVHDGLGVELTSSTQEYLYGVEGTPGWGRLEGIKLNGVPFAQFTYGVNGEVKRASFAGGDAVDLDYDLLTRRFKGSTQSTPEYTAGTTQLMNSRGLVGTETLSAGTTSVSRVYEYSAQRFLWKSSDALATYEYGFDDLGLPTSIKRDDDSKPIVRFGNTLTAGSVVYTFDVLGQTTRRGDLTLTYGPDGQIATATRGSSSWSFVHDEAGQRLLKRSGATPLAAYLEEGYLDATGLTERVQVAGRTVGVLKNGAFTSVSTDARGTVIAETDGAARFASPFGWRDVHPSTSEALDYVEKGFDADLGLVRMGVRDYDPEINRFTTPDPLFVEEPGRCVTSPPECNLYSYAGNDPIAFADPSGLYRNAVLDERNGITTHQIGNKIETHISFTYDHPVRGRESGYLTTVPVRDGVAYWRDADTGLKMSGPVAQFLNSTSYALYSDSTANSFGWGEGQAGFFGDSDIAAYQHEFRQSAKSNVADVIGAAALLLSARFPGLATVLGATSSAISIETSARSGDIVNTVGQSVAGIYGARGGELGSAAGALSVGASQAQQSMTEVRKIIAINNDTPSLRR